MIEHSPGTLLRNSGPGKIDPIQERYHQLDHNQNLSGNHQHAIDRIAPKTITILDLEEINLEAKKGNFVTALQDKTKKIESVERYEKNERAREEE